MKWKNINNKYESHLDKLKKLSPYELLEVDTYVTKDELKRAYWSKIKLYHPDSADKFMRKFNEEVSKLINYAFDDLSKKIK